MKKIIVSAVALLALTGCGKNVVDGKSVVEVPATPTPVNCYLLEVDREDGSGESEAEDYFCVSRQEYDRNKIGEEWVGADGKKK
jgi:hypothetical protein